MDNALPLGATPRPTTSEELERLLLDGFRTLREVDADWKIQGGEHLRVNAILRGADVEALTIDATGIELRLPGGDMPERPEPEGLTEPAQSPEPVHRESATLRRATLRALPLLVQGVGIEIEAEAQNAPFDWLELPGDQLAVAPREDLRDRFGHRSRISLRVGADRDAILPAILAPIREEATRDGIHLSRERITLHQLGPRRIRIGGRVRVRWRLLAATYRGSVEVHVDNAYVLRMRLVKLSSTNLVAAAILLALRGRIRRTLAEELKPVDLNAALAPWNLRQLKLRADRRVEVKVELVA